MKKSKKLASVLLSLSMIVSSVAITNPTSASASKKVALSTKKLTVTVGQSKKLKLKNNKKKVKWTVTSGKKNITLKSKKKTGVTVVGKKKGTAKVQAKIGKKKYTCKVTVKAKATAAANPTKAPSPVVITQPTKEPTTTVTVQPTETAPTAPTGTPTVTPSTETTDAPTVTPTTEPTGAPTKTPEQGDILTLYYNGNNAEEVVEQIKNSDIPVHVIVESSVTDIGYGTFWNCSNLESITVAEGNKMYDSRNDCNAIIEKGYYVYWDNGWDGRYYPETDTYIPGHNETEEYPPNGIEPNYYQPAYLIAGCKNTKIPDGDEEIRIEEGAFYGCTGLTDITIPKNVTDIAMSAFFYCSGLSGIIVDKGNEVYDSRGGCNAIIATSGNVLVVGCKNTVIPDDVEWLQEGSFKGCSGLTEITIPASVTWVQPGVFEDCSSLISITVDAENEVYDSRGGCNAVIRKESYSYNDQGEVSTYYPPALVTGCKTTIIPNDVGEIAAYAFCGCSGLTSITIPNSVTKIGDGAFRDCSDLTSITIPDSVTSIGYAFNNCNNLTSIIWKGNTYTNVDEFMTAFRNQ